MEDVKPINLTAEAQPEAAKSTMPAGPQAKKKLILWLLVVVLLGAASGYGLTRLKQPTAGTTLKRTTEGGVEKGATYGVLDEKSFRDSAEGELAKGGVNGEGSHHLVRSGGESQNVYLTSSIVDLDEFIGRKVKVWGETFEAQKAGWLMDVGRLEVLE